jgi:formylmethanofuran dehydrogenase subunit E
MLQAYRVIPDDELLVMVEVELHPAIADLVSQPGLRVECAACGEEIINEREVVLQGRPLCRACAGPAYYRHPIPSENSKSPS